MSTRTLALMNDAQSRRRDYLRRRDGVREAIDVEDLGRYALHYAVIDDFGEGVETPEQAIRIMCALQSLVTESGVTTFPSVAAGCFCPDSGSPIFRNDGQSLGYIVRAVIDALMEDTEGGVEA